MLDMPSFLIYKKLILDYSEDFLKEKAKEFAPINKWSEDVMKRLMEFMSQGKMLRGSLVFASHALFSNKDSEEVIRAAVAVELLHSSLIAHDDIMDRDTVRRGKPAIWMQYGGAHFGESMAICFGDIGFFLAFALLSKIDLREIITMFSKELSSVVLAQMQDVYYGFSKQEPTKEEIIKLYIYKTGRYTFSLPFMIGAVLAQQNQIIITSLGKIGELLGILFQLKDDELGLFGDEKETGKLLGSDIRQNKKTIYRHFLFQKLSDREKRTNDFNSIYDLYKKYNIQQEVKEYMIRIEEEIKQEIEELTIKKEKKKLFYELLTYNLQREK